MKPYDENLVYQTNEKVKAAYAEANREADAQYPIWIARTMYDYCDTLSWAASETKHLRELKAALGIQSPIPVGRKGRVIRDGRAFADDSGPWCALGATLFWAVWGYKNDRERLRANLQHLRSKGVDFVRILLSVGAQGYWTDRSIDPHATGWAEDVAGTLELIAECGLRASVTILGDNPVDPEKVCRDAMQILENYPETIQYVEVCNESFQVWKDGQPRFIALCRVITDNTSFLVASSCAQKGCLWNDLGTIGTAHLARNCDTWEGNWRPVRQPWGYASAEEEDAQEFCVNQEPIGPDSSVASEKDPDKLVSAAVVTWIAGMSAYVLHAGAGIRGGGAEDVERGRKCDWMDETEANIALDALAEIRKTLPPNLPNWDRRNAHWAEAPYKVDKVRESNGTYGAVRVYSAAKDGKHVTCAFGVETACLLSCKETNYVTQQKFDATIVEIGRQYQANQVISLATDMIVYGGF